MSDDFGLLEMGFCDLTMIVLVEGQELTYLKASSENILLYSPTIQQWEEADNPKKKFEVPRNAVLKILLVEDSTELLELPFDITITSPDCTLMRITKMGPLKNMVITIGRSNKALLGG